MSVCIAPILTADFSKSLKSGLNMVKANPNFLRHAHSFIDLMHCCLYITILKWKRTFSDEIVHFKTILNLLPKVVHKNLVFNINIIFFPPGIGFPLGTRHSL